MYVPIQYSQNRSLCALQSDTSEWDFVQHWVCIVCTSWPLKPMCCDRIQKTPKPVAKAEWSCGVAKVIICKRDVFLLLTKNLTRSSLVKLSFNSKYCGETEMIPIRQKSAIAAMIATSTKSLLLPMTLKQCQGALTVHASASCRSFAYTHCLGLWCDRIISHT